MISYHYRGIKHKTLKNVRSKRMGVWVRVEDPNEEELRQLRDDFGLEEDLLHDALDPNEVPRMEEEEGVVYVIVQAPFRSGSETMTTVPVLIAVGSDFVLTISKYRSEFLEVFLQGKRDVITTQKTRMFIRLFFSLNASYTRSLAKIGKELRALSANVGRVRVRDLERFVQFEKTASDFSSALVPMRAIVHRLLSERYLPFYEEDKDLVEDLFLDMGQLIETSRSTHRHVVNIRESSSVIMTHNLNRSIRTLTILTIILSIPMILASLYGMNVALPLGDWDGMFWAIIFSSLIAMGAAFGFLFKR